MDKFDVDEWLEENGYDYADVLLSEKLPKIVAKLNRVDNSIVKLLDEIRNVFPEAEYYTASGGFNLLLGPSHDDKDKNGKWAPANSQSQRVAWSGKARIGDGDF